MQLESSYINLLGLRFHAFHGVMAQEQLVGNDYLYEMIRQEMQIPSCLLEHVAYRIGNRLMTTFPQIESIDIHLTKKNPPMGADGDGAMIELHLKQ